MIYNTMTLIEIYPNFDDFKTDYESMPFPTTITETSLQTTYFLLVGRYANNPIANMSLDQFKYKLFGLIWQYAPTWEKKVDIQEKIRTLTDEDISKGSISIFNKALNPQEDPNTTSLDELEYINEQNTNRTKRGKLEGYSALWNVLVDDVTEKYLRRFKPCFKTFIPRAKTIYCTEEENNDE